MAKTEENLTAEGSETSQNEDSRREEFSLNESSLGILDLDAIQCKALNAW